MISLRLRHVVMSNNDETFEIREVCIRLYFTKVNTELLAGEQLPIGSGVPSGVHEYTIGVYRVTRLWRI